MRPLTFLAICAFLLSGSAQAGQSGRDYRAVVQVVSQNYCYGDDDVFTVSLDLRIEVVNSARTTLFFASDMVPYTGRVAGNADAVRAGQYVQEWTPSQYLTGPSNKPGTIQVKPGHSFCSASEIRCPRAISCYSVHRWDIDGWDVRTSTCTSARNSISVVSIILWASWRGTGFAYDRPGSF